MDFKFWQSTTWPALVQLPQLPGNCRFWIRHSISKDIRTFKHVQLSMGCYKKSCDQLQLGLVLAIIMITMHFILPWDDWQLQIQRHSACLVLSLKLQEHVVPLCASVWGRRGREITALIDSLATSWIKRLLLNLNWTALYNQSFPLFLKS